ncbi:hypothetical protein [Aliiroseovarius crassostreae]|uniref:hypothetical protein n=1 Tax=Aliiroseovarius crassostreae TaxID=154981 RepID=UPI0021FD6076|nr:hypothetical protein [Aliiroseovarius crassostreae]UWQ05135.1 hypothetical protein K3X22_01275 [Aliiroseovarius crassostreae]
MGEVRKQAPTVVVPLREFSLDDVVNAYGETKIEAQFTGVNRVIAKSKADIHYLLFVSSSGTGPGVIVQDLAMLREETMAQVASHLQSDGRLILTGFIQDRIDYKDRILADLAQSGITAPDRLYQLDVYWGSREEALKAFLVDQWGMAGVSVFVALALGWATRTRYRAQQSKKRERKRRQEEAEEAAWADSPIQSTKGWRG